MKNVYLFQPQYAVERRTENTYWIPYSVGCLWSYASQFNDIQNNFELKDIFFKRENPDAVLLKIQDPVYCGFSCYVWNYQYNLILAEKIKQRWPKCVIQFGGPQTSGTMIKYEFIDSIILAEGEEQFVETLRNIQNNKPVELVYNKTRLENLHIPSPYTTGVFDQIIKENSNAIWSMTFETNRGCPYQCTFCDWGSLTYTKIRKFEIEHVRADLEWAVDKPIGYLFCADGNFGIFKERDLELAKIIKSAADRSSIDAVNLQYAKNSTEVIFEIAKIIGNYSRGITVSVQSMNPQTLQAIKRSNMELNDIANVLRLSEEYNISTYTDVILGLPLETKETWKQGLSDILELGQHQTIDMVFAVLLENSELNSFESKQKYGIQSIRAKDYMPFYNANDWREVDEDFELVNSTNTMSTEDMIESYMYGWMIIHFHTVGYSQLLAKYCRHVYNISYRKFYDMLFALVQQDSFFYNHFNNLKNTVQVYLNTGELHDLDEHIKGAHGLHGITYKFLYNNKAATYDLVYQVASNFGLVDSGIAQLQRNFIFDTSVEYPLKISTIWNIKNWQNESCQYSVSPKIAINDDFDFYQYRRQGYLKNKITKVV